MLDNPGDFTLMEKFLQDNTERYIDHYLALIEEMLNNRWKFLLIEHRRREKLEVESLPWLLAQCLDIVESIAVGKGVDLTDSFLRRIFSLFC